MKPDNLTPHPEGGRFKEVFRSEASVVRPDGESRSALTHIYFQLRQGEVSRFHHVAADEVWNLYQGKGLVLLIWDGSNRPPIEHRLSAETMTFCHVVPAGHWQAAKPLGDEVLVGCSVGPGFDFADFELIDPSSDEASQLLTMDASLLPLIGEQP